MITRDPNPMVQFEGKELTTSNTYIFSNNEKSLLWFDNISLGWIKSYDDNVVVSAFMIFSVTVGNYIIYSNLIVLVLDNW